MLWWLMGVGLVYGKAVVEPGASVRVRVGNLTSAYHHFSHAVIAYCDNRALEDWRCRDCRRLGDASLYDIIEDGLHQGKVILTVSDVRKEITVAFRGSKLPLNSIYSLFGGFVPLGRRDDIRLVHSGYNNIIKGLLPKLTSAMADLLDRYPKHDVIVTGHSLGGALAALAVVYLHQNLLIPWYRLALITFGQPRVGNLEFVQWLNSRPLKVTRVVNQNDPIAHLPIRELGYYHTLTEVFLQGVATRICSSSVLEDPKCSAGHTKNLQFDAHNQYWDLFKDELNCLE